MPINHLSDERPENGRSNRRRFMGSAAALAGGMLPAAVFAQDATPAAHASVGGANADFDREAFDATFSHHTATVNDVRLHYVMGGQGEPLVLLHGWPQTWYEWRHVMPALAEQYTVIAPDMRGLGDSSKPLSGYDQRTVAADIHGLVAQLGYSSILLAGHDLGGWVAYAYAAAHREEVRRLAIIEIVPADEATLQFTTLNPQASLWHFSFHYQRDLPEALITGRERLYLSWFYGYGSYNPAAIDEAAIDEYVRCYAAPGGLRAGFEYYRALFTNIEQTKEDGQTPLEMPVLTVGGAASFGDFVEQAWASYATNIEADVIPEAGHFIPEDQPGLLRERLLEFFRG